MSMAAATNRGSTIDRVSSYAAAVKRVSWGAVFAGTVIAIVTQLLLGLLGIGVGIASIDPVTASSDTGKAFGIGLAIWWVISSLISLFIGGWIAGRLAGFPKRTDGSIHGVVAWAVMTMFSLYLVTTAVGNLVGGTLSIVGQSLQTASQAAITTAANQVAQPNQNSGNDLNMQQIRDEARQALKNPETTMTQMQSALDAFFTKGPDGQTQLNREAVVNQLVQNSEMSREQAERTVTQWEQTANRAQQQLAQVKEDITQTASDARKPVAAAAIWSFIALALGAVAAGIGGGMGAPRTLPVMAATSVSTSTHSAAA
jgi:hypothetical protein